MGDTALKIFKMIFSHMYCEIHKLIVVFAGILLK